MECKHRPDSRRHLEAFASLRGAPGAGRVEEGCSEAYVIEGELQKAVHCLLQKRVTDLECLRLSYGNAQTGCCVHRKGGVDC